MTFLIRPLSLLSITFVFSLTASAASVELDEKVAAMNKVGSATFKFLFWPIYDAELYAEQDAFDFSSLPVFILQLNYQRNFLSEQLVNETKNQLREMDPLQVEAFQPWLDQLGEILPDVKKGDSLSLYVNREKYSSFYLNGNFQGIIEDENFSRRFAAIWLDREDRYADFTRELTGVL